MVGAAEARGDVGAGEEASTHMQGLINPEQAATRRPATAGKTPKVAAREVGVGDAVLHVAPGARHPRQGPPPQPLHKMRGPGKRFVSNVFVHMNLPVGFTGNKHLITVQSVGVAFTFLLVVSTQKTTNCTEAFIAYHRNSTISL